MPFKRTISIWLLLLIIIGGAGVRSYQLTSRSLWFDEAFSWRLIQFPVDEMITRAIADVHPPLYYLLLRTWSIVFGSSLLSLRSFSVTCAAGTIAAAYLFTAYAFRSRRAGLLAATLLAVSGFQIQYAWEARMYTLGTFLLLLSSWLLLHALRSAPQRIAWWLAWAMITAAFAYTHYYSFFSIVAQVIFIGGYIVFKTRGRIGEILQWRLFWYALISGLAIIILLIPWLPAFWRQNSQVQASYWIPPIGGWSIPDTFYRLFAPTPGIPAHQGLGWIALALLPIILTILGWLYLLRRACTVSRSGHSDAWWTVLLGGAVPFLISIILSFVGQSLYQDRFFVFADIFILIALAVIISGLTWRWLRWPVCTLAVIGLAAGYAHYWLQLDIPHKPGAYAATSLVAAEQHNGEPVIVSSPFIYFAVLYYAQKDFAISPLPQLYSETGELAHFAGGPILAPRDITGPDIFNTNESTLWIVDTSGFGGTKMTLPDNWRAESSFVFPEVFGYQGEVFVTKYQKQ
ncbi:MAG: glycosyltransferase family 39 protein [bacterium]|nr:glycosyltransferase family 39 protein [bacterium]MDZ4345236.1 glycosyltransferase family 39 protein [Candidatus Binatia bacterium]